MSNSRREFLKRGTWMALAAGVPLGLSGHALGMGAAPSSAEPGLMDRTAFEKQLHTQFLFNHEAAKVPVTLVEVTNLASHKQNQAGKEAFSLIFRGPKDATLKQNTYLIEHEKLGLFSFLVVPVKTRDNRAAHYAAIINRLNS
jgi:hypothetical protein